MFCDKFSLEFVFWFWRDMLLLNNIVFEFIWLVLCIFGWDWLDMIWWGDIWGWRGDGLSCWWGDVIGWGDWIVCGNDVGDFICCMSCWGDGFWLVDIWGFIGFLLENCCLIWICCWWIWWIICWLCCGLNCCCMCCVLFFWNDFCDCWG